MQEKRKPRFTGEQLYHIFIYVVLAVLAICILVPVAWVFMASIKQNAEFYGSPWGAPSGRALAEISWTPGPRPAWVSSCSTPC